jgi:hypothetical protein
MFTAQLHADVHVRFWPLADIGCCAANVRYRGQSRHHFLQRERLLLNLSRH